MDKKRLVIGELPKELLSVKREARAYRRVLEAEVMSARGTIGTTDCHLIDSATAATLQAGVIRWLLREKIAGMSVADIRGCTSDMVKAKAARDAAVKSLDLDRPPPEPWLLVIDPPALPGPDADGAADDEGVNDDAED